MPRKLPNALQMLEALVPEEKLVEARKLALEIQRDDFVRDYMSGKGFLISLAGIVAAVGLVVGTIVNLHVVEQILTSYFSYKPGALMSVVSLAMISLSIVGAVIIVYLCDRFLERRALRLWDQLHSGQSPDQA